MSNNSSAPDNTVQARRVRGASPQILGVIDVAFAMVVASLRPPHAAAPPGAEFA